VAFDAGSIEATLTLNRNPFTAGLAAARQQARNFNVEVKATLDQASVRSIKTQLERQVARIQLRPQLDRAALLKVKQQIERTIARVTVRVVLDRASLAALRQRINSIAGTISLKLRLDQASVAALRQRLRTLNATVNVKLDLDASSILALRARIAAMSFSVNVNANSNGLANLGNQLTGAGNGASHFYRMLALVVLTLPLMASALTASVGAVGAITSAFLIAGLGAAAFGAAVVPVFKEIRAAVVKGQDAINALPPSIRGAAQALKDLEDEYVAFVERNRAIVAVPLAQWFRAGEAAIKTLDPLVTSFSKGLENVGKRAQFFFESPWWRNFVAFLSAEMSPVLSRLGLMLFDLITIVGNLTRAFWQLGGREIFGNIVDGISRFALWTEKIGQNKTFIAFMDAAKRSLPVVAAVLGTLLEFVIKVAIGLEPLGTLIWGVLNTIFEALNQLPPEWIGAITLAFGALWVAIGFGAGGAIALVVASLAALAAGLGWAYTKNEQFRTTINAFADDLRQRFVPIWDVIVQNWETKVKPAWDALVDKVQNGLIPALQRFWKIILDEVMPPLKGFADTLTGTVIPAVLRFLGMLVDFVSWLIDVFGPSVAEGLASVVQAFDGTFQIIGGLLDIFTGIFTGNWDLFINGVRTVTEGVLTIIAAFFGVTLDEMLTTLSGWADNFSAYWISVWEGISSFFSGIWDTMKLILSAALALMQGDTDKAAELIGQAWRKIANLFREPINWVIRTVIGPPGGIAGAWNTVMGWIGQPQLTVSAPPQIPAFARGGVLPGYAPRQDSMLAAVSPGEAVMVPEWTKAVGGPSAVAAMNAAAMSGSGDLFNEGSPRTYSHGGTIPHFAYGGVAPHVAAAGDEISRIFGRMPGGIGGVGARASASDHPSGHALDFMTLGNVGLGNRVASHLLANFQRMALTYIIWLQRINSGSGWRGMADRGSPTANHMDHVHASFVGGAGAGAAAPVMVSWWSIIADKVTSMFKGLFSGSIPGLSGPLGNAITGIPAKLVDKVVEAIKDKLEGLMTVLGSTPALDAAGGSNTSLGFGTADRGAVIPPGLSILNNQTGAPEPLTNLDVYKEMMPQGGVGADGIAAIVEEVITRLGVGGGDTYNVILPEKATVRELAEQLSFQKRVTTKGRYSR
jgi:hypothetical protein